MPVRFTYHTSFTHVRLIRMFDVRREIGDFACSADDKARAFLHDGNINSHKIMGDGWRSMCRTCAIKVPWRTSTMCERAFQGRNIMLEREIVVRIPHLSSSHRTYLQKTAGEPDIIEGSFSSVTRLVRLLYARGWESLWRNFSVQRTQLCRLSTIPPDSKFDDQNYVSSIVYVACRVHGSPMQN